MRREIDLDLARRETPGCEHVLHFNNAGAALMPQPVLSAVVDHLTLEARVGGYEAAELAQESINSVYASAARLLGCGPDEIAVVENATVAWNTAFHSLGLRPGDEILTGMSEYSSNYISMMRAAERAGAVVRVVPDDEYGQLSVEALRGMVNERVKLIAVTHVPTNGGLVNPAAAIGEVAREAKIFYLLDACQSVGQMGIDVRRIGCDALSVTGRKFLRGPRGTGLLYVRRERVEELDPPFLDLHSAVPLPGARYAARPDARRFENWESNMAAKIGLGVAIEYALGWGIDDIEVRVVALAARLRSLLAQVPRVRVRDAGRVKCGIVSFNHEGIDAHAIRKELRARDVNVSVSGPLSSPLDMEARGLSALVRASVHYYNTDGEVERFCEVLEALDAR